jgi:16S rRNA G966 N2-methylase RsmD
MMKPETLPPEVRIMKFILAKWISKPIYVAASLEIADLLVDSPMSVDQLAQITATHAESLFRLLRALASVGIFCETNPRVFANTPLSKCLTQGKLQAAALLFQAPWHDAVWENLLYTIKTGSPAFEKVHGRPAFQWFGDHPDQSHIFQRANEVKARQCCRAILAVYDFAGINTLTDLGGGTGGLMVEILQRNPNMHGCVAELEYALPFIKENITKNKLEKRLAAIACDFFQNVPPKSDAYLLSHILHDWPDEACVQILTNCRKIMTAHAKVIIIEGIVPPSNEFSLKKQLDLEVLLMGGGRERTQKEFEYLLKCAGLRLSKRVDTQDYISVIEGHLAS